MKIAVPIWENRVSPLFDSAAQILVAEGKGKQIEKQEIISVASLTLFQRIDLLQKLNVEILICGGITRAILDNIRNKNIQTIPFVCGEVRELLQALFEGKDIKSLFSMPGKFKKEKEK